MIASAMTCGSRDSGIDWRAMILPLRSQRDHRRRIFEQRDADEEGAFGVQVEPHRRATLAIDRLGFVQHAEVDQVAGNAAHRRLAQAQQVRHLGPAERTGLADDAHELALGGGEKSVQGGCFLLVNVA
ncbi:hypothetical protein LZK73_14105 [Neorhizobium galegae]|nr:hypothetical protein LZK73_14105 [Neorhizobium galegae]